MTIRRLKNATIAACMVALAATSTTMVVTLVQAFSH